MHAACITCSITSDLSIYSGFVYVSHNIVFYYRTRCGIKVIYSRPQGYRGIYELMLPSALGYNFI